MKYKELKWMLKNIDRVSAEDIGQYAIFENQLNDPDKHSALSELISRYGNYIGNMMLEKPVMRLEAENGLLRERIAELESLMQEFVDRVDRGEVRSKRTYQAFKKSLEK